MHRKQILAAFAVAALALGMGACGVDAGDTAAPGSTTTTDGPTTTTDPGGDPTSTTRPLPGDRNEADEVLSQAVDATMDIEAFGFDTTAHLEIMGEEVDLSGSGAMDFSVPAGQIQVTGKSPTSDLEVEVRADGETLWLHPEGDAIDIPEGKTWLGTTTDWLDDDNAFGSEAMVGVVLALKGSVGAEAGKTKTIDGAKATEYTTTINYDDALAALGPDADTFQRALNLSSPQPPDLDISVWVDEDGIVRDLHLDIVSDGAFALGGTYDLAISDPGGDVPVPEAPPGDQVLTGPAAERIVQQLLSS